jgi:hypothetical protein
MTAQTHWDDRMKEAIGEMENIAIDHYSCKETVDAAKTLLS